MQLNFIDPQQVADLLEGSNLLARIEGPGSSATYVLEYTGQDIVMTVDGTTGDASVTYPCSSFDQESGGSVHDHARAVMRDEAANDDDNGAIAA